MLKKIILWAIALVAGLGGGFFVAKFIAADQVPEPIQKTTRFLMDTYCTIQVPGDANVGAHIAKAFDRLTEIDVKFNTLNTNSPLYAFNHHNQPITDPEIIALIRKAQVVSTQSAGALDVTIFPLVELWGFFGSAPAVPAEHHIHALLPRVNWRNLAIENGKLVKLRPDVCLDLGAIAKGYAAGEAAQTLKNLGVHSALVDLGGNLYAMGQRYGKKWRAGIRHPRSNGILGSVELADLAVATSGDYERYFIKDGVRYHHIFDPQTGHPARGLMSATAITADPTLADAYSTALFVLGAEKALQLVAATPNVECVLVTEGGRVLVSPRLQKHFSVSP